MFSHRPKFRGPTLSGGRIPKDDPAHDTLPLSIWDRVRLWLDSRAADESIDRAIAGALAAVCIAAAVVLLVGWNNSRSTATHAAGASHASAAAVAPLPGPPLAHAPASAGGGSSQHVGPAVDLDPCDDDLRSALKIAPRFAFKSWQPTERCRPTADTDAR